jgi:thiamine-phosphate pyrophosphorylase
VAVGPVFGTLSKENPDPVVGLDLVREVRQLTLLPLVAIGGIVPENAGSVVAAGADGLAVIGGLAGVGGLEAALLGYRRAVIGLR